MSMVYTSISRLKKIHNLCKEHASLKSVVENQEAVLKKWSDWSEDDILIDASEYGCFNIEASAEAVKKAAEEYTLLEK